MIILFVGVLLILYGILSSKKFSVGVGILFVLLIMGFQEGVPGDYYNYYYAFEHGGKDFGNGMFVKDTEFVFSSLANFFSTFLNFHSFVFVTSLLQCLLFSAFIKKYANRRYQFFGVLLVFFTYNIMLLQMKAIRQGYAVDCMLLAYYLLDRRNYIWSLFAVVIAYGFHNTCILSSPFFLILFLLTLQNDKNKRNTLPNNTDVKFVRPLIMALALLLFYFFKYFVFQSYITPILQSWEALSYEGYMGEIDKDYTISWWILVYYIVSTLCVSMYMFVEKDTFKKYLAVLVIVSYFLAIGVFGFGNLQRIVMYFIIFSIVVLPNVAAYLGDKYGRYIAVGYIIFNMAFLMLFSVVPMLSMDFSSGSGFGSYTFSFLK